MAAVAGLGIIIGRYLLKNNSVFFFFFQIFNNEWKSFSPNIRRVLPCPRGGRVTSIRDINFSLTGAFGGRGNSAPQSFRRPSVRRQSPADRENVVAALARGRLARSGP